MTLPLVRVFHLKGLDYIALDLGPYVDISVKLVLHFFFGIRINVTLVSEKVDSAILQDATC